MRTERGDMPGHLKAPYENVAAHHHDPEGTLWELRDGRFFDPSHLLQFAREHGQIPVEEDWERMVQEHAADTKAAARWTP